VEGASGSWKAGLDETGWKRTPRVSTWCKPGPLPHEVPVAYSPRLRNADNAELGLAIAAHVEIMATVGWRRVNGAATQGRRCRQRPFDAVSSHHHGPR